MNTRAIASVLVTVIDSAAKRRVVNATSPFSSLTEKWLDGQIY
jgi:hypothetical protein